MVIEIEELIEVLRIPNDFKRGQTLSRSFKTAAFSMTISYGEDGIQADLAEEIDGESSIMIMSIDASPLDNGRFFVVVKDERPEAAGIDDPQAAMIAFGVMWAQLYEHGL